MQPILPRPFTWSMMKGLGNYALPAAPDEADATVRPRGREHELERILAFAADSATGDRADLDDLADDSPAWREIAATRRRAIGSRCPTSSAASSPACASRRRRAA